jgi:hypothetical protein
MKKIPSYLHFDQSKYIWKKNINYREQPEKYKVGRGEQGVLICEPYKSEILAFWRFKDKTIAEKSSNKIFELFLHYLEKEDFVGADMARKFLQMGFTRARRYANYKGGRKYDAKNNYQLFAKGSGDPEKIKSAAIFFKKWKQAEVYPQYKKAKENWKNVYG